MKEHHTVKELERRRKEFGPQPWKPTDRRPPPKSDRTPDAPRFNEMTENFKKSHPIYFINHPILSLACGFQMYYNQIIKFR